MENLKKNLHFVALGAGVLLGIIFLGIGMFIRGGTESELAEQQEALKKFAAVETKGNLDRSEKRAARFDESLVAAQKTLAENQGTLFASFDKQWTDGLQFFSEEANAKLEQLKARFTAMERPLVLPALLIGWKFARSGGASSNPWSQLDQDMAKPPADKIREMQMRLRVLEEVATTIEKLLETGAGDNLGLRLVAMKFPNTFGPIGSNESESPWLALPVEFEFECSPAFAILLAEELGNPSQRTLAPTVPTDANKASYKRIGFPVLVDTVQTVMMGRQHEMRLQVSNEDKPGVLAAVNDAMRGDEQKLPVPPDPKSLDPEKADGQKLIEEAQKNLNQKDRLILPVQVGLKIKAVASNKNWRAVKAESEDQ